jgi:PiT family inorganic phosphate transporter
VTTVLLVTVVALALTFSFCVGVQDVPNAIATAVATHSLEVRSASYVAAGLAFIGTVSAWALDLTVPDAAGLQVAPPPPGDGGLVVLGAVLVCACGWLLIAARSGLPVSSTHTLVAAMAGGTWATGQVVDWAGLVARLLVPMALCAAAAFVIGWACTALGRRLAMAMDSSGVEPVAQVILAAASAATAMMVGLLGSAKTVLVLSLALTLAGQDLRTVPAWVVIAAGAMCALGMVFGGRRIIATLGELMVGRSMVRGASIQGATIGTTGVLSLGLGVPVSTTHTIGTAMIGSSLVTWGRIRWLAVRRVVVGWLATLPLVAVTAALLASVLHLAVLGSPTAS